MNKIKCVASELKKYCKEETVNNFPESYKNAVGLKCLPSVITENGKAVGQIIYLLNDDKNKFTLGDYVEFLPKKVNWKADYTDPDGYKFFIVNPFFCKKS